MRFIGKVKMNVLENYKWQFQDLIQREYDGILNQIEQIIAHHGEGTDDENKARSYADFLYDILRNIE